MPETKREHRLTARTAALIDEWRGALDTAWAALAENGCCRASTAAPGAPEGAGLFRADGDWDAIGVADAQGRPVEEGALYLDAGDGGPPVRIAPKGTPDARARTLAAEALPALLAAAKEVQDETAARLLEAALKAERDMAAELLAAAGRRP